MVILTRFWSHIGRWMAALLLALTALAGGSGCGNPVLGPDSISLGMNVTEVRERMGGAGTNDPGDYTTTEGAHVTEFYWNYNDIRLHFNMQTVVEIFRLDPELGIWVRTQPPLKDADPEPAGRSPAPSPTRPVPGMRTPTR